MCKLLWSQCVALQVTGTVLLLSSQACMTATTLPMLLLNRAAGSLDVRKDVQNLVIIGSGPAGCAHTHTASFCGHH